jgi:DNA mismatch repair protein MutL
MKKSIRRLDESVSSRIAAGEVIENPASVVKELLENALDASARTVRASLRQGGKARIVVEDDGHGIPFEELPLAVERFATSKISGTDDLEKIGTLGYRGEALASLAAVSRLEIRSLAEGSRSGGLLRCTSGTIEAHLEIPVEKGTRVQADDLFFNLPARKKFLKQAASETRKVIRLLRDYAVAWPEVEFYLACDGRAVYSTAGVRERRELLGEQWGNDPAIHFKKTRTGDMVVEAFWQPRSTEGRLTSTVFVNRRRVTDPVIRAALSSLGAKASGLWFLLIEVPPGFVDVNIHPAKAEVRFKDSGEIFQAVRATAELLVTASAGEVRTSFRGNSSWQISSPPLDAGLAGKARTRPEVSLQGGSLFTRVSSPPKQAEDGIRYLGMIEKGYLLYENNGNLVIVDPHAAHERILYEQVLSRIVGEKGKSQGLSVPVALPPTLSDAVAEYAGALRIHGFSVTERGGQAQLEAVPAVSADLGLGPVETLRTAVEALQESGGTKAEPRMSARWALLACKRAVKLGEKIDEQEALRLWRDLLACENPGACPHGRPTFVTFDSARFDRLFGRE